MQAERAAKDDLDAAHADVILRESEFVRASRQ